MPTLDEEMSILLGLAGPFHALACFIFSIVMKHRDAPWSPKARVAMLVVNALIALGPIRAAMVWTSNSWFASLGYGVVALEVLGVALLARAAFSSPTSAKPASGA